MMPEERSTPDYPALPAMTAGIGPVSGAVVPLVLSIALHAAAIAALLIVPSWGSRDPDETVGVPVLLTAAPSPMTSWPARRQTPSPVSLPARESTAETRVVPPSAGEATDLIDGGTAATTSPVEASTSSIVDAPRVQSEPSAPSLSTVLASSGPGVTFAGLSAPGERARSIVYVVDASGPMVTSLPWVLSEVQRSVGALAPTQRFSVVLFRDLSNTIAAGGSATPEQRAARAVALDAQLLDATARQRERLATWLGQVTPGGRSCPLDGLRAALAMKPQIVFLLSRSIARSGGGEWGQGLEATLAELDRLNPRDPGTGQRRAVIKTIQFLEPDPTGIMAAIGREHGSGDPAQDQRVLTRNDLGTP